MGSFENVFKIIERVFGESILSSKNIFKCYFRRNTINVLLAETLKVCFYDLF